MKKSVCFLVAFLLLAGSGCNNHPAEPIGVPIEVFQEQAIVVPAIEAQKEPLVPEKLSAEWDCHWIFDKVDSRYWVVKSEMDGSRGIISTEQLCERSPYRESAVQFPDSLPRWRVGSGKYVILQNRYVYQWKSYNADFTSDQLHDMKLTCLDARTGKVTIAAEMRLNTPLVYLCPLDDTHFLSYYVTKTDSDRLEYATLAVADIYGMDGTKTEIIREVYENDVDWSSSIGTLLEILTVKDGEIYGFGRRRISNAYRFFLYHYSRTGELLDTEEVPEIEKVFGDEQPLEFFLIGDYIVTRTYESLTTYICKRTENGLEYIAKGRQGSLGYGFSEVDGTPYLFFIESTVNPDATVKEKACPLYALNTATGEVTSFLLQLPLESPYFYDLQVLSDGDIVLSYCEGVYNPLKLYKFFVEKETLEQRL